MSLRPTDVAPDPAVMAAAIGLFRSAIGADRVDVDASSLDEANRSTLASDHALVAILRPKDHREVSRIVRVADRYGIPLHAVSTGKNWGYGSRRPCAPGAVLVSLAALDAIEHYDAVTGTVVVGPGVTFRALAAFLSERGGRFEPPRTGSSPETSIIGNILERGIGKGLYEDMQAHLVGLDVVMPDGAVRSIGPMSGSTLPHAGPDLRGLFVQSNLGIAVRARISLSIDPPLRQLITGQLDGPEALASFVEASRSALQVGDPWLRFELVNAARSEVQGDRPRNAGWWLAVASVWGRSPEDLALRAKTARNLLDRFAGAVAVGAPDDSPTPGPGWLGLLSAYAGTAQAMPADPDPDRDRCGVVWVSANLRHHGTEVACTTAGFEAIMGHFGFAPAISLRAWDGRSLRLVSGLFGDRDRAGDDERATACRTALHDFLARNQLASGRHTVVDASDAAPDGSLDLARALKRAVDPRAILAPGRYIPSATRDAAGPLDPSVYAEVGFAPVGPNDALDALAAAMSDDLHAVVETMPGSLVRDVEGVFAAYTRGRANVMALYYRPSWSFLHHVPLASDTADRLPALRRLHALTLLLHLWDDHLTDGQLAVTPARLQLRSRAWSLMEAEATDLERRAGIEGCHWRDQADTYLSAVQDPDEAADLEGYLALGRRDAALACIAPALHAAFARAEPDALVSIVSGFGSAWRIVDDIQDIEQDAVRGRASAVRHALSTDGAAAWDRCRTSANRERPDPALWERLTPHLADAVPGLIERANRELARSAATARRSGWDALAAELAASRVTWPARVTRPVRAGSRELA